jgi:hypothetical protein
MLPNGASFWYDQHEVAAAVAANIPTSGCAPGSHKLTLWATLKDALPVDNCFVADTARR